MRHFAFLSASEREHIFHRPPDDLAHLSTESQAMGLGATLYTPGTRSDLDLAALRLARYGTTSNVWCLEDSVPHDRVPEAEANVVAALQRLEATPVAAQLPLLYLRVRSVEQLARIVEAAGPAIRHLHGFSLPKFTGATGAVLLPYLRELSERHGQRFHAMPILESPELVYEETRACFLGELVTLLDVYADEVLCVRLGGTDLSGVFGLRRDRNTTIWDIAVVKDALTSVVNRFGRNGRHIISGVVWEHIPGPRLFRPGLRATPFEQQKASGFRQELINHDVDALIREISLDKNNGIHGKTVIHPTHVPIVNALHTVTVEEYDDALAVHGKAEAGGVLASPHGRMNEMGPHALWARQTLARAEAFGVIRDDEALIELLTLGQARVLEVLAESSGSSRTGDAALDEGMGRSA